MSGTFLLLAQALIYFGVMATLFRLRHMMGLGAFLCALGVMHFLETYLAAVFFIELPFGLLSPGSTVLFSGKLAIILLFYIREDAETVRQPIYGLLIGNFLMVALVATLRLYGPPVSLPGYNPDLVLIDQMGALMVWGTTLLFVDSIALILIYEKLRRLVPRSVVLRAGLSLAIILTFDQLGFFVGLHMVTGTPLGALFGGWVAKMGAAAVYAALIGLYLGLFERDATELAPQPLRDVFHKLTYRHKYEELLGKSGFDALTGALTRERFEALGQATLARCAPARRPVSLAILDVDHFKSINDRYGHVTGDEVLRRVVECLRTESRSDDLIFRYGGEEFVVLCENMPHDAALASAERMRLAVGRTLAAEFAAAPTISIGVATFPEDGADIRGLVAHADAHLYEAKRQGRDRVVGNRPAPQTQEA
ncbi:diguanylate cyclase [Bosea thiooxidans]|uniref:diguanylate cyclase n=1 Tax=Bosea thiooxidans TaxID=53254 RepID=A0A0Q3KR61_9HYPH|nr:GGDEF domain-containing protein [Bosea thiooxidans]KQK32291.1 diguanylate cyclase [Bosea thiooxidans]SKC09815.1 diguanylate cyclase (GGDEF) domain-containing protein [Bosea thiooxidans]